MKNNYVVSASQMRQLDQITMEQKEINSFELMKHAGTRMSEYLIQSDLVRIDEDIVVVAGTGNNGGDSLVIAASLKNKGYNVSVILVGKEENLSDESKVIWSEIKEMDVHIHILNSIENLNAIIECFVETDIIIDGIFGIGLTRDVTGYHKGVISMINHSDAVTISIDIPSGLSADNGLVCGIAVDADHTLVVQHLKQGNLLGDAQDSSGKIHLIEVGIVRPESSIQYKLVDNRKQYFEPRKMNSHKYHYGCVLTLGGSKGMMGAPILSGFASLRTGSGLSKVLYHSQYLPYISNPYPSLMVDTYSDIKEFDFSKVTSIVFGPGLGKTDTYNLDLLHELLKQNTPLLIDADGIYYLKQILEDINLLENVVITPHYGEMALLLDLETTEISQDPVRYAKSVSEKYGFTVILKGSTTIITNSKETYFSSHGNPGMATAGSGDVLCGIIASLLGRKGDVMEACKLGVLIHCKAANYAVKEVGYESLIASDITANIPKVLK